MKKVLVMLTLILLTFSLVLAQDNESDDSDDDLPTDNVEAAYQCLEDLVDEKDQGDFSLQEAIFSTLALGGDSKLTETIDDFESNNCWPSSSCALKDTAQVVLAHDRINKNTDDAEEWLLDQADTATELVWYLQIDIENHVESSCTISYDDTEQTITIGEDMKISGNAGSCLSISSSGFWLKVSNSNDCIEKTYRTSCDQGFITSLLYQREGSSTIFVSPTTNSASALGTTEETINSLCFKDGGSCDYEGTLWAALALDHTNHEISAYLPYLLALSEENLRLFPSTFLHILTQGNDQYSQIVQAQQQSQFWQAPNTAYNTFYDSALAMLSLQGSAAQELSLAQDYFLSIQTPEGCWNNNNIRDTAFLLYAGWPEAVSGESGAGSSGSCISQGYDCVSSIFTCTDAGGAVLDLECDAVLNVCCSVPLILETCSGLNGIVCSATQACSGLEVNSIEGSCCLDSCQEVSQATECEVNGGSCHSECISGERQESFDCDSPSNVCCISETDTDQGGSGVLGWIIGLLILIALVVLGIVYRKKLQLWLFKLKNRKKGGRPAAPGGRPPYPPYGPNAMKRPIPMTRRPRAPIMPMRAPQKRATNPKTDKELDDTLKKLKEMSK